jgi:ribonuclease PH
LRSDGRRDDQLRPIEVIRGFSKTAAGSVLIQAGETKILCTASFTDTLPPFLTGQGGGWITAEYGMLPGSTHQRKQRETRSAKIDGRTYEIQRLIGRSLRAIVSLKDLPEKSLWVDCDVLAADGGTRTLAITGSYLALCDALAVAQRRNQIKNWPLRTSVAAVSVGMLGGRVLLDLNYAEDSQAEVDMNVVMTGDGQILGIQGGSERTPFSDGRLQEMLAVARAGCEQITRWQQQVLSPR